MTFAEQYQDFKQRLEESFLRYLPAPQTRPQRLHEAMHYSLQAGGKRLRPILLLGAFHALSPINTERNPLPAAVALECLHTYSLIHDDLPSLDNSDLRRGLATCHKQFDEATALLAGDALLTIAFDLLSEHYQSDPLLANQLVRKLSVAAGSQRLIGGQMEDILGEKSDYTLEQLEYIHLNKTAALIQASLVMGTLLADADAHTIQQVEQIGLHVGLAFQIIDDILDATSNTDVLGKSVGSDAELQKTTYVKLLGLEEARKQAENETNKALQQVRDLHGETWFLAQLIEQMGRRIH
jgi:geranylgeranyl diphosphate synthase type II